MTRNEIKITFAIILILILSVVLFNIVFKAGIIIFIVLGILYLIKKIFFS